MFRRRFVAVVVATLPACAGSVSSPPIADAPDDTADAITDDSFDSFDAVDAIDTDAAAFTCPNFATSCPEGCFEDRAQKFDSTHACPEAEATARCGPNDAGCSGTLTCFVRLATGDLYLFGDDCDDNDGWRYCTAEESAKLDAGADACPPSP